MQINSEKKIRRRKITFWVIFSVLALITVAGIIFLFMQTEPIWKNKEISNMVKLGISCKQWDGINRIYIVDKGEKFIVIVSDGFIGGEHHSIYDIDGNWVTNEFFEYTNKYKIEMVSLGNRKKTTAWIIKKEDGTNLVVWKRLNSHYEVLSEELFHDIFYGIKL